jgi:aryl-alcohol dehydrogenase-like predicted oxidoreductase
MKLGSIPGSTKPVSRIVFGGDRLGFRTPAVLDRAWELGVTTFETARIYPNSENVLGAWLACRRRDDVFVVTKGGAPGEGGQPRLGLAELTEDLSRSLDALKTDHVDLYLIHYDAPSVPIESIVDALSELQASGKIRAFGAANCETARMARGRAYALAAGKPPFVAGSPQLSLPVWEKPMWPGAVSLGGDDAGRRFYRDERVPVFAYSCLGRGFFLDRYWDDVPPPVRPGPPDGGGHPPGSLPWLEKVIASAVTHERQVFRTSDNRARYERAVELGSQRSATAAQIGLAWLFHLGLDLYAIVGCDDDAKLRQNIAALDIALSDAEVRWLEHGAASSTTR